MGYCRQMLHELYSPLAASSRGELDGDPNAIPLILMCETVLSAFPAISTQDMPYQVSCQSMRACVQWV